MKKTLYSIIFVLIALFAIDRVGGLVMYQALMHTKDVAGPKIRYLVNDVNEDVVLMGTSRCNSHYVPSIISDSLGVSVYNGGVDASVNIFAHYILLNHILAHHTPKVIVLDVDNIDLLKTKGDDFKTIGFYAPYVGRNEHSDSVFREAGRYWEYKLFHLYRYNSKAPSTILGLFVDRNTKEDHGYLPGPKPLSHPQTLPVLEKQNFEIDSRKQDYLQRFVSHCKERGIIIVFSNSPNYRKVDSTYYQELRWFADKNDIPFLDYVTQGMFIDRPDYFRDDVHMWDESARLFSSFFAHDLKHYLLNIE